MIVNIMETFSLQTIGWLLLLQSYVICHCYWYSYCYFSNQNVEFHSNHSDGTIGLLLLL